MRRHGEKGFSLIEAAVAIAIMAILAGAAAPLILKSLNQQREQRARDEMKLIYSAMFGTLDRSAANMCSDFGYTGSINSAQLVVRGTVRAYAAYPTAPGLSGGWRGPYWLGNIDAANRPTDPWGRPYVIRQVPGAGWQVLCTGANGNNDTLNNVAPRGDDFAYPVPAPTLANGTLSVNVLPAVAGSNPTAKVTAYTPSTGNAPASVALTGSVPSYSSSNIPPGTVLVTVQVGGKPDQSQVCYMPPKGTVTLTFYF